MTQLVQIENQVINVDNINCVVMDNDQCRVYLSDLNLDYPYIAFTRKQGDALLKHLAANGYLTEIRVYD